LLYLIVTYPVGRLLKFMGIGHGAQGMGRREDENRKIRRNYKY
jgi:hypothetical protein